MNTYTVQSGQTLLDIALELHGAAEAVWPLAARNGREVDEALLAGDILVYDEADTVDENVVSFFRQRGVRVNSGLATEDVVLFLADQDDAILQDYDDALIEADR